MFTLNALQTKMKIFVVIFDLTVAFHIVMNEEILIEDLEEEKKNTPNI